LKQQGLVEHWNGTAWSIVPDASSTTTGLINLNGVAAVAANDVWVVGYDFIEHWNGTSWSVVANPNPNGRENLNAVEAISSNDVWAVGSTIIHWDGTAWSVVPHPSHEFLFGITAVSSTDVWAVGNNASQKGVIEHWDGKSWTIVASPTPTKVNMDGVAAASATDIWAVGSSVLTKGGSPQKVRIEHWDGTQWTIDSSVKIAGSLSAVSALLPNNAWAVGSGQTSTLILHWDGTAWNVVPSPNPDPLTEFNAVTHVPGTTQVWTVGFMSNYKSGWETLTVFHC
jgi:hypothetical protein